MSKATEQLRQKLAGGGRSRYKDYTLRTGRRPTKAEFGRGEEDQYQAAVDAWDEQAATAKSKQAKNKLANSSKPTWNGPKRGGGWEAYLVRLENWKKQQKNSPESKEAKKKADKAKKEADAKKKADDKKKAAAKKKADAKAKEQRKKDAKTNIMGKNIKKTGKTTVKRDNIGAPTSIENPEVDYKIPKVEAEELSTKNMQTSSKDIEQLDASKKIKRTDEVEADTIEAETVDSSDVVETPDDLKAANFTAERVDTSQDVEGATGTVSEDATAEVDDAELSEDSVAVAAERDEAAEKQALADSVEYSSSDGAFVDKVTGEVASVEATREAVAQQRTAITGEPAPDGEAAEIMSMYEYDQLQKRSISKANVIRDLRNKGLKDEEISKRLADNPQLILDEMDSLPEDIKTTLSGLPQEALMSAQMESLMAGMEDGEIPAWARPALAKVESNLAKRGMSSSSVGRDALFNAIIQSAMPIAQSNSQAIQSAVSDDKQIAANFLAKNAEFEQQMNLANLSNDQQMRLANLSARNQASSDNLNAAQQTELANLNSRLQTNLLQGKIASEMNQAQLNVDQQRAVVNAQTVAGIDLAKFNAAQQVELTNSKFMQTMVANEFNADQQAAMQNATNMASMDMANLDKNTKLAVTNAQAFLQMDMANLSNQQQATILSAQQSQQAMLSNQAATNAAKQFNAASQQQTDQFMANLGTQIAQYNSTANAARKQFNVTEQNRIAAVNAGNDLQAQQLEAQLEVDISKFNEQQDFQRDQWNAQNAQAIEQSNVAWRRQSNLADTAAQNAVNQSNAQMAFNLTSQELTHVWQELRDQAAYIRQSFENDEQRKAQYIATAIGNEKFHKGIPSWVSKFAD